MKNGIILIKNEVCYTHKSTTDTCDPYDYYERRRMTSEIEMFTHAWVKKIGVMAFLNKLGWEAVSVADMALNGEIVDGADTDDEDYDDMQPMMKLRLSLVGVSADILVVLAALTSEALKVSDDLTYTLRESARDEEDMSAIHIHIVNNGAYWNAVNAAAKVAKVAKYGCLSCSECKHQFDDWTTHQADGGRRKRPVVNHPLKRGTFRVLPCKSCPAQFRKEFESRMAADLVEREAIQMKWPDTTFCPY
jgi:hypothetical protein